MPDPANYDNQDDFVSACIAQRQDEHPEEDTEQSAAICYSMWSEKSMNGIVRKTHADQLSKGMEFVLSDMTPDRYNDIIDANGWDLKNFSKNPIALFNHNSDFPIGRWENLSVKDGALRGHLQMAPAGASARIDEIRALIDAGILRAVSVGFRPIESQPLEKSNGGLRYLKSELVETSLVSVPANPNALAVSKALGTSDETIKMVFRQLVNITRGKAFITPKKPVETEPEGQTILWQGKEYPVSPKRMTTTWQGKKIIDDTY